MLRSAVTLRGSARSAACLVAFVGALSGCNALADWDELPNDGSSTLGQASAVTVSSSVLSAEHTCAIVGSGADSTATCWGRNVVGQLGAGDTEDRLTPTPVVGLRGVKAIGTGLLHTCAIDSSGAVYCWGSNRYAALGRGTKDDLPHPRPERVAGIQDATRVHCGMNFTCVETKAKTVACWGTNDFGQLGDGTTSSKQIPKPIASLEGVTSLSAGGQHACAVAKNDAGESVVYCWGYNDHGQLGQPPSTDAPIPTPTVVPELTGVRQVVTGDAHTCAVLDGGTVKCWGANDSGQLGSKPSADRPIPADVEGLSDVESIGVGAKHSCALATKRLYCWGSNLRGQLGVAPSLLKQQSKPRRVHVSGVLEQIEEGYTRGEHTCAVRPDRSLYCWGWNNEGQLGNGTRKATSTPAEVRFSLEPEGS